MKKNSVECYVLLISGTGINATEIKNPENIKKIFKIAEEESNKQKTPKA